MYAKIYQPAKNAMQSGKAGTKKWQIDLINDDVDSDSVFIDSIMGWTGSTDTNRQLRMKFTCLDAAIKFIQRLGMEYIVIKPNKPIMKIKSYSDNFK